MFELIHLCIPTLSPSPIQTVASTSASPSLSLWHSCLGHVSFGRLQSLVSRGQLGNVSNEKVDCLSCQLSKQPALLFNKSDSLSYAPFDLIHSDVWDPAPTSTMGGSKYFIIFIDDFTQYTCLFLMKNCSELSQIYYDFSNMVKT